ncbi:retrovirus-related pol polyprotein from transposon TNT 1-94 [Tanacetum coccineum]
MLCKQAEKGVPLQAEQADWLEDTNEEIDEQELEAHYGFMAKIQEVLPPESKTDTEPLEHVQHGAEYNVFANEKHHSEQSESISNTCAVGKRVALANLIANLKLDIDENKKIQKKLKKANASLTQELGECKSTLAETSRTLGESNSIRNSCLISLQNKQTELEKYMTFNDRIIDYDKLEFVKEKHDELVKQSLLTKSHFKGLVNKKTKVITDLKSKEEKDIDKMISMEKQLKFLNEIIYKRNQSIQTIHMLAPKGSTFNGRPTVENLMYLKKAQSEKPCLHEIPYDTSDPANKFTPDRIETLTLEKESRSKFNKDKNDSFTFVHELKQEMHADLKYVESLEKEIDELEYDKAEFSNMYDILLQESRQDVRNTNVIKPGMYRIDTRTTQTRAPQLPQTSRNTNPRVSTSTGVIHKTNVSRPQLRSTQMKDKVVPNNSQVKDKKTEVEDHPRISSISNKTKSVTASNDSLKSRTSNVNAVCATCGKCVFNSNHDACVSKYLNDVNARTKKPKVVPISTRKPKSQANKSVATPHKKTVASESTTQKSKSYYRMLYEKTSKAWKWWIEQQCPSGYKWVPKTKTKWVPKVRNENVQKRVSFAIDNASRITNIVQLILFIVDSGCTKHMTGNLTLLCNFVEKYMGTVRFGNDQFALILGYGDLVQGNITINRVYYVKGLNHNLFSVGQFCDANLVVAFRKSTCFVRDLQGNDLLIGNHGSDLYTISLQETTSSTPLCLMAKASPTHAWLWHRRLSHLNFDYINLLSKKDVVNGLPKQKYVKDQLCSSCEVSKAKKKFIQDKGCSKFERTAKFASYGLMWSNASC